MKADFSQSRKPPLEALDELDSLVLDRNVQPLHQLSESAVLHWIRVVEDKEPVQLRYPAVEGSAFEFFNGMESDPARQLAELAPANDPAAFEPELDRCLSELRDRIDNYFDRPGYRGSMEQCDQAMLALARASRFFAVWRHRHQLDTAWKSAAKGRSAVQSPDPGPDGPHGQHYFWEPYLNDGIVAWEQNSLQPFDAALARLRGLLRMTPAERAVHFLGPGYPLRAEGRPRIKVTVFSPQERPLLGNSFFHLRWQQLVQRLEESRYPDPAIVSGLQGDVRHFISMIRENCYMLASEPGFLPIPRPGLPVVRTRATVHPFLLDPMELFKKAILFDNGTYTRSGGGLDPMFLQVRQLDRYYRFHRGAEARRLKNGIDACTIAWEENRWTAFTSGLVNLAKSLRDCAGVRD